MRKKVGFRFLMFISLFALPMMVFANSSTTTGISIEDAFFMEAFVSIHMSVFVLIPIAKAFSNDYKKLFWILFAIRAGILLYFDCFVTTNIALFDFFAVFVGAFVIVPIVYLIKGVKINLTEISSSTTSVQSIEKNTDENNQLAKKVLKNDDSSSQQKKFTLAASAGIPFERTEYAPILFISDKMFIFSLINKILKENSTIGKVKIPEVETKKTIFTLIYLIIVFLLAVIYFLYHVISGFLLFLFVVITAIYGVLLQKYGLKNYLFKQVQSRPDEKVNYVVSSVLSSNVSSSVIPPAFGRVVMFVGVILILGALFWEPHLIFKKVENGYDVQYYTIGIARYDTGVSIPSSYKGEDVVGIRRGAFKNLEFLKYVEIPNTVTEIRDSTFKNCQSLESIGIPEGVTRIGNSAFRNCSHLYDIVIPKTVTEIGRSAFRGTGIKKVCISVNTNIYKREFNERFINITYYEYGCVNDDESKNGYNEGYIGNYESKDGYDKGYVDNYESKDEYDNEYYSK